MKVATAPYDQMAAQYLLDQRNAYEQSLGQTPTALQAPMFQPRTMSGAPSMMPMMPTNFFGAPRMNANQFFERGGMGRGPMQNRFMPQVLPSRGGAPSAMPINPFAGVTQAQMGQMPINMAALGMTPLGGAGGLGGVGAMPPGYQPDYGGLDGLGSGGIPGNPGFPDPRTVQQTNTVNPLAGAAPGGIMRGLLY